MSIFLKGWNGGVLMKRFFALVVGLCVFILSGVAFANYPTYLNGDRNLILCDGHMGVAWYVDRTSLVVQKYEPPQYIIAVNVVSVQDADMGNTAIHDVRTMRFFYNYDMQRMYIATQPNDSDLRYLNPNGCRVEIGIAHPAGKGPFRLDLGMDF